jgi:alpha-glucosidase
MWWRDAVVYQIYPRSFQDSDGDGIGDLRGIAQRLDHLSYLGVDALWLSPIYPSPLADFGYDVSDYTVVDPVFGSLEDLDELLREAHARGLKLLLDLVTSHTSIEHPWFREHPDWYIWSPVDGPPNNWKAAFGGSAWSPDERSGRWYLHTFYPEQPDLDWRNPEVVAAMQNVVRFWLDRGVDGFRVDALNVVIKDEQLRDDPPASGSFPLPLVGEAAELDHVYSGNRPEVVDVLAALREAAGDSLLVGEVYLPTAEYPRYLEHLDLVFAFELLFSPWDAESLRAAIGPAAELERVAWVLSNHDFDRLASRLGAENVRAAALLLLTLPGCAFVYQGDEIGLPNGPGTDPPYDRAGRDRLRHPMQWDASPSGGFTSGEAWLPPIDPGERNVEDQRSDPRSLLSFYRELIALRRRLGGSFRLLPARPGTVAFERGPHVVAVNTSDEEQPAPTGEVVLATHDGDGLSPHAGVIVRA